MTKAQKFDHEVVALNEKLLQTEGQILCRLIEMKRSKLFAELNYSGIYDYCERRLKFSEANAFYFKTVAEAAIEIPELKAAVVTGSLSISQARRIAPVINKENCSQWIEKAKTVPQKILEKEVTAANPRRKIRERIKPVAENSSELRVTVDSETEANIKALQDILSQKLKRAATLSEVIAWMAKGMREKHDPIKKAERSISLGNPENGKMTAGLRHRVNKHYDSQCSHVSADGRTCQEKRWLDMHHIVPRSQGGKHTFENLRILCKAHHQYDHAMLANSA